MSVASSPAFNALLPSQVTAASSWFGRARSYPIFGPSWYRYRSYAHSAGCVIALLVLGAFIGTPLLSGPSVPFDWINVAQASAVFALPLLALCLVGPGLAVMVRRRALARFETVALGAVLIAGIALSAVLFAALLTWYEMPRHYDTDTIIAHSLHMKIEITADDKSRTYYNGPRSKADENAMAAAIEELKQANLSANAPTFQMEAIFTEADQQAMAEMGKLDTGRIVVTPARRAEIVAAYQRAQEDLKRHQNQVAFMQHDAKRTPATPRQVAAMDKLAAATARIQGERPVASNRMSRQIGVAAVLVIAIGALLLAGWLGGLADLLAFTRQRGQLAEVLAQEELERTRAARNQAELRLSVLAAQVEPHFLFNTLASVRSAIESDPQRAAHIVDQMVLFLRASIPQMRNDASSASVTLASQLQAARAYLALMHERMPRLQFSVDVDAALEAALVPPLMLISLVENAVKHGVEPKIGPAHISVLARRIPNDSEPQLEVTVSDDGVGFGESSSGGGIGLTNIQERLRSVFGARAGLTLKALPAGGIAAILRLPLSFEH